MGGKRTLANPKKVAIIYLANSGVERRVHRLFEFHSRSRRAVQSDENAQEGAKRGGARPHIVPRAGIADGLHHAIDEN